MTMEERDLINDTGLTHFLGRKKSITTDGVGSVMRQALIKCLVSGSQNILKESTGREEAAGGFVTTTSYCPN